ncbi:unnamed protein product [Clonostachys rhizophaga]|uniref:FAD dependent oxidoreductase domain-containing protein n=1 Tax=Clonostachys rhizophaga TaxID=160324 RepID=A0A9N9YI44_9HYPO|nr:unnamed protein product [Clonostachys rhizophaga]
MDTPSRKSVAIVGAGVFGLSLALALRKRKYKVDVFDQHKYDLTRYEPGKGNEYQVASVDHNKIACSSPLSHEVQKLQANISREKFRASYGKKIHYQRLALESRQAWENINISLNEQYQSGVAGSEFNLFQSCGMLRVQPTDQLDTLERETLESLKSEGHRDAQFVKGDSQDRERAMESGWDKKLLDFTIPETSPPRTFEAVLDSLAGFTQCSQACAYVHGRAVEEGVTFHLGPEQGKFDGLVVEDTGSSKRAVGLKTKDGSIHKADTVVSAAGSFSTQLLPDLAYHLESSAGSVVTYKIDKSNTELWDKYSPQRFPVITWKSAPRSGNGKDTGSIYVFPRTPEGLIKIGYRGIKWTNFQTAPANAVFSQDGQWSIPLSPTDPAPIPDAAKEAIKKFVSIFLPDFMDCDFYSTKLCWYTDSLDNSFVVDYVPTYADKSVFVCTGGSGHGAKFLPVLGDHAADILEHGEESTSYMRKHWQWRESAPRSNGLEDGPNGPRNLAKHGNAS